MNLVFIHVDLEVTLMYVHLIRATTRHVSLTYAAIDTSGVNNASCLMRLHDSFIGFVERVQFIY